MPFKWTPETRERALLLAKEMPVNDIASDLGAGYETVRTFLTSNGIKPIRALGKSSKSDRAPAPPKDFGHMIGVRFENVTKDEARKIMAGAPPSTKPRRQLYHSVVGCAAAMCVQP
jgi:hypothetical protein